MYICIYTSLYIYILPADCVQDKNYTRPGGGPGHQITFKIGSLSTVPDQVINGFSFTVLCSRMVPSSEPTIRYIVETLNNMFTLQQKKDDVLVKSKMAVLKFSGPPIRNGFKKSSQWEDSSILPTNHRPEPRTPVHKKAATPLKTRVQPQYSLISTNPRFSFHSIISTSGLTTIT